MQPMCAWMYSLCWTLVSSHKALNWDVFCLISHFTWTCFFILICVHGCTIAIWILTLTLYLPCKLSSYYVMNISCTCFLYHVWIPQISSSLVYSEKPWERKQETEISRNHCMFWRWGGILWNKGLVYALSWRDWK